MPHVATNKSGPITADKVHKQPSMTGDIFICLPNVRDHRWLPVARPMPGAKRLSIGRDAGSHSVDRMVRLIDGRIPLGHDCEGISNRHHLRNHASPLGESFYIGHLGLYIMLC